MDILEVSQLQQVGALLLQQLYHMKHNGAVEKTQIGLLTVCERLLRCSAPSARGRKRRQSGRRHGRRRRPCAPT